MLTKATIEIFQGLVYLSHNLLLLIPIKFNSKYVHLQNNSRLYTNFNKYIWPPILYISLGLTIFEFCYFCMVEWQTNLVILLYHGTLLFTKSSFLIAYIVYNTAGFEFCQLFNAVFYISYKKQISKSPKETKIHDDARFALMLAGCAVSVIALHSILVPTISLVLPCLHKSPFTLLLFGDCHSLSFRVLVYLMNVALMFLNGPLGAFFVISTYATINCINKILTNIT